MTILINAIVVFFISIGVIFTLVAVIGVVRLPGLYMRSHAATKSVTFGVLSVLVGVFLYFWLIEGVFYIKLLLGIFFLFFTAPIGGHLIARAAYISGVEPSDLTTRDDLAPVIADARKEYNERKNGSEQ